MDINEHSVMGRLISELSWEGKRINRYRDGVEAVIKTEYKKKTG